MFTIWYIPPNSSRTRMQIILIHSICILVDKLWPLLAMVLDVSLEISHFQILNALFLHNQIGLIQI